MKHAMSENRRSGIKKKEILNKKKNGEGKNKAYVLASNQHWIKKLCPIQQLVRF